MLSVTCTFDFDEILQYPADIIVKYLASGIQKFGVLGPNTDVIKKMTQDIDVRVDCSVKSLNAQNGLMTVTYDDTEADFDQVVVYYLTP